MHFQQDAASAPEEFRALWEKKKDKFIPHEQLLQAVTGEKSSFLSSFNGRHSTSVEMIIYEGEAGMCVGKQIQAHLFIFF